MEWAYVAGIVDGDGSIKCYRSGGNSYKGNKPLRPRITIGQKERLVLDEIQSFIGTNIKISESGGCYYYQICQFGWVRTILWHIKQHLIVKKEDAEFAWKIIETWPNQDWIEKGI